MKVSAAVSRVKVSADGHGVVSHAGVGMLRELADLTGLSAQVSAALADTYQGPWIHAPGDVFADLAAAVADGADCVDGVGQLWGDREQVFGAVASTTTLWRLVDERIDAAHLPAIRAARAHARAAGLGCRSGAGSRWVAASGCGCHHHHRPLRQQGERGRDLEENVRLPSAAGVFGPPRHRRRGSSGRAATGGQRRQQHHR